MHRSTHIIRFGNYVFDPPAVWLGQSVDTSVLTARVPEMRSWPMLTSLGDAIRRRRYINTHFNESLRTKLGVEGPLMVDSGGYVLMTQNVPGWSVRRVAEVYRRLDADVLVSLDHPALASDDTSVRARKRRLTITNLSKLAGEFGADRLMPVIHGVTTREVERNCIAVQKIVERPTWVGMGGLVPILKLLGRNGSGAKRPHDHFAAALAIVRQAFPRSLIHIFGAGSPRSCLAAFAMGAHSADSQGWRQAAGFGSIYLPGKGQRILEWNRPDPRPRPIIDDDDRQLLQRCICPFCRNHIRIESRVRLMSKSFEARSIHNAWILRQEVTEFRSAVSRKREATFLEGRLPRSWLRVLHF